ncbi:MAG: carcinine hydrolase/isopenicillin-N N-acyltransferase family protein [Candidatus Hodarchaeales archaeon]|jgi:hypothetical protein
MGCTTGAKILDDGRLIIAFKNKDFKVESYSDSLCLEHSHSFGVRGVNLANQKKAGFSIGVNQYGLVAVNSNILATSDQPYDLITKRVVLEAKTVNDAVKICEQEIQGTTKYQWCNMVIATPKQLVAVELTSSDLGTIRSNDCLVRTNHHLVLNTNDAIINSNPSKGHQKIKNSEIRYNKAEKMLRAASDVQGVHSILKSHQQDASICRHGYPTVQDLSFTTVYSYLVTVYVGKRPKIFFDVVKGPPCLHSFTRLELEFPLTTGIEKQIRESYSF